MTEAACAALCFGKHLNKLPFRLFVTRDNHLRDALSVGNDKRFIRKVDKDDTYLASVVGIDGAGRIEDGDAMLDGKAASGTHLCFVARRQSHEETCGNKVTLHWPQLDRRIDIGTKVNACGQRCCILWQRMTAAIDDLDFHKTLNSKL